MQGLGKTLSLIALIATNYPGSQPPPATEITPTIEAPPDPPPAKKRKVADKQTDGTEEAALRKKKRKSGAGVLGSGLASVPAEEVEAMEPPSASGPRPTLVICPLSVLSNWTNQIEEHTRKGGGGGVEDEGGGRERGGGGGVGGYLCASTTGLGGVAAN